MVNKTSLIKKEQRGATAVEMAIILPILIIFIFAIIEFSLLLYNMNTITHAAREGARVGVVYNKPQRIQQQEINAAVKKYIENNLISFSSTGDSLKPLIVEATNEEGDFVTGICPQGIRPGTKLKVTVKFDYSFLLLPNFIATFFSGNMSETISLTSEAIMICE